MLIQLPVETWIEILDWLKRRDLLKKLDKLWDKQFTPILQDWLHKYTRNVRIGFLWADRDGFYNEHCWVKVPFAGVDMPGNITGFEQITIRYLDSTALAFLLQLRPLFHNIHLVIDDYYDEYSYRTALRSSMPIFGNDSIESITFDLKFLSFFSTNYPSTLLNAKLLQIWYSPMLSAEESEQIMFDWLFTKRDDGHVRILVFHWSSTTTSSSQLSGVCEKIRERFMNPARQSACPFFIRIWIYRHDYLLPTNIPNAENVRTGEQLTFKNVEHDKEHYRLISNCPMNTNVEWLTNKEEEVLDWEASKMDRAIRLQSLEISTQLYAEDNANQQQKASGNGKKLI